MPVARLQPIQRIFVKLERRSLIFDQAGWREIPVPVTAESETASLPVAERALAF